MADRSKLITQRQNPPTREILAQRSRIGRHVHATGYVSLVLDGAYHEAGDNGRFEARPGTVLVHQPWDAHQNHSDRRDVSILNFDLPDDWTPGLCWGEVEDADLIVRLALRDPDEGLGELRRQLRPLSARQADWPDLLAARLLEEDSVHLGLWARAQGLDQATVSSGFHRAFGIPPLAFRRHIQTKKALRALTEERDPLCRIAAETGFSDQAHMSRSVKILTGQTPGYLRRLARAA